MASGKIRRAAFKAPAEGFFQEGGIPSQSTRAEGTSPRELWPSKSIVPGASPAVPIWAALPRSETIRFVLTGTVQLVANYASRVPETARGKKGSERTYLAPRMAIKDKGLTAYTVARAAKQKECFRKVTWEGSQSLGSPTLQAPITSIGAAAVRVVAAAAALPATAARPGNLSGVIVGAPPSLPARPGSTGARPNSATRGRWHAGSPEKTPSIRSYTIARVATGWLALRRVNRCCCKFVDSLSSCRTVDRPRAAGREVVAAWGLNDLSRAEALLPSNAPGRLLPSAHSQKAVGKGWARQIKRSRRVNAPLLACGHEARSVSSLDLPSCALRSPSLSVVDV